MASRNQDGSIKIQPQTGKHIHHNGGKVIIADSRTDTVDSRKDNTSTRT